jgi:acetyl-CoA synthetase
VADGNPPDAPTETHALPTGTRRSPGRDRLDELRREALADPETFWRPHADELYWHERAGPIFRRLEEPPYGRWFEGWKTNLCYNALDRWVHLRRGHQVAFYWEGEPGDRRAISYYELHREVERLAAGLRQLGIRSGDRVTLYLPLVPEAIAAMLATVRLGAIHSVVFAGFAAQALADRINDSRSKLLITADGGWRGGKVVELKRIADQALALTPSIERVVVVRRTGREVPWVEGRDLAYHDLLAGAPRGVPPVWVEADHPSFVLYTSGTTGKPKGAVHGTGGYMLWLAYTQQAVFDLRPDDVFWCTADIGWVTGHSYVVYGPLLKGATSLVYEGAPTFPAPDRWWGLIERYGVSILNTSPTAIRSFIQLGEKWPAQHDLSSLRLLGTVGEPINPGAWHWYDRHIGRGRCTIVDSWWQTETGGILISPQPGTATIPLKPGSATLPLPGVDAAVVDENGVELPPGRKGLLVIRKPWPGQFRTLWGDEARYRSTYFARFPGWYYPADFALRDEDGYFWLLGRADEVMKVAGHRIATTELEDILIMHPAVAESAVIGRHDAIKGEVPVACVILRPGHAGTPQLRSELLEHVRANLGPVAVPAQIYFVDKVPKTRSAKIMRRLIRDVVEERPLGDVTTLEDETSLEEARRAYAELRAEIARESRARAGPNPPG